ncbi:Type 1 phosphatases regulator ypi1 [Penicillium diatomitis]|uniref:Type 1 phosphatases regulator n=1 Tax=Penicillium diatomitis TaxID=2819901 RepID=A0A9W9XF41_9EURO|nr:Type 1 phosphatases regulator ypi1 [Penicillium diatomitis]KAJ5489577.1 Type 1 phosphatases regulator ypi1 [Penicillium diatomitis]
MSRTRHPANIPSQSTTETSNGQPTLRLTGTLRLRGEESPSTSTNGAGPSQSRRIRWSEDVVDNEGMGKKSSKVCCIFHKARPVGESSSEESSSSSSDSDSDSDYDSRNDMARRANQRRRGRSPCEDDDHDHDHEHGHEHNHSHDGPCNAASGSASSSKRKIKRTRRKPSPNAYEKMPRPSKSSQPRES